jgi:hypothetical protein
MNDLEQICKKKIQNLTAICNTGNDHLSRNHSTKVLLIV